MDKKTSIFNLTSREATLIVFVLEGANLRTMANYFNLSARTIRFYLRDLHLRLAKYTQKNFSTLTFGEKAANGN